MCSLRFVLALVVCVAGVRSVSAQTPALVDGWVVLPLDEYRRMREIAEPRPQPPPSIDAVVSRIDYELRVGDKLASGQARVTIDVLRDGGVLVQMPERLLIRQAVIGNQAVSVTPGPPPQVLMPSAGRHVLILDLAIPVVENKGLTSVTIPESYAAISRATLVVPPGNLELGPFPNAFLDERVESATESRWTVYGVPKQATPFVWRRKPDTRRLALPLRTRATVTSYVGIGEELAQLSAAVGLEIVQGVTSEISLALPAGLSVNQVDGASVAEWDATGDTLRVRFLDEVASNASFTVGGEFRAPRDGTIAVPLLRVPAAERESGGIAVDVVGAGEIANLQMLGLERADPTELGAVVAGRESPSMVAFRLRPLGGHAPRSLSVGIVRYTPEAVLIANVEEARYRVLASEDGKQLVEARYVVRNNQRGFLKVTFPPRSTLWTASVAGRPTRPGVAEIGAVLLPLEKARAGNDTPTFPVELVYLQDTSLWSEQGGRARIELPALDLPVSRTGLTLYYPPRFQVTAEPGTFRVDTDRGPFTTPTVGPAAPRAAPVPRDPRAGGPLQALVDRFNRDSGSRVIVGALPVRMTFPSFGPSVFLACELTPESQTVAVDLSFKRGKDKREPGSGRSR